MNGASGAGASRVRQRLACRLRNKLFERLGRNTRMDEKYVRLLSRPHNGLERRQHVERHAFRDTLIQDAKAALVQGVSIRSSLSGILARNHAASSGPGFDDDVLAPAVRQNLRCD